MPTNRTRRTRKLKPTTISTALLKFFKGEAYAPDEEGACDVFLMELRPAMKEKWELYRDQIMADWMKKNPCSRPFGFWKFDAPELRKQINGSCDVDYEGVSIDSEGLPAYWQIDWDEHDPPIFESEAAYLKRHDLLTLTEKTYLKKHPELMEAEKIEFEEDDKE